MKDSVFLKSFTQNEKKLLKAGEYMEKFKDQYEARRYTDNFHLISPELLKKLVEKVRVSVKDGKIYKGKAG